MLKKIFKPKKTNLYPVYFVISALIITLGVMLLPVFQDTDVFFASWGGYATNFIIFAALVAYIILYLVRQLKRAKRESIRMLVVVEIVLFSIVALGTVLEEFNVIKLGGPCIILGVAVWIRGCIGVIGGYLYRHTSDEKKYSVIELLTSIILLTVGTALVVRPFFTELTILWILSVAVILSGFILILIGILAIPEKKKKAKSEAKG